MPPSPPDEICSNLTTDPKACLQDDGVPYGCANINSKTYDGEKRGNVWFCDKTIGTREDCDSMPEEAGFKWCPYKNEPAPAPAPPPPPPSPCTSPTPDISDFPGYIQINNSTDKTITLWHDILNADGWVLDGVRYPVDDPSLTQKELDDQRNQRIIRNLKELRNSRVNFNSSCITPVEPNGYRMNPNSSLFIKLEENDVWISFGMWATINDIEGNPVLYSKSPPNIQRILEITMNDKKNTPNQVFFNNSYVDGFNGTSSYSATYTNESGQSSTVSSRPCNLRFIKDKNSCESIGGRCKKQTPGIPTEEPFNFKGGEQQIWTCTNPKFWANEKIGIDLGQGGTGCPKPDSNTCECLNTWYNNYNSKDDNWPMCKDQNGSDERCPRLWYKNISENCPSSYAWAYQEHVPVNINDDIFTNSNKSGWCPSDLDVNNADLQSQLVDDGIFKESNALDSFKYNPGTLPKIVVNIEYIWDPQDCDETWRTI